MLTYNELGEATYDGLLRTCHGEVMWKLLSWKLGFSPARRTAPCRTVARRNAPDLSAVKEPLLTGCERSADEQRIRNETE